MLRVLKGIESTYNCLLRDVGSLKDQKCDTVNYYIVVRHDISEGDCCQEYF